MNIEIKKLGGEGILEDSDILELRGQRAKVYKFMSDGLWHYGPTIVKVAGGSEGLRRLRELREIEGVKIVKSKSPFDRSFLYKMEVEDSDY